MAWFNNKHKVSLDETPAVKRPKSDSTPIPLNKQKMKDFIVKAIGGIANQSYSRERFTRPEYNLWEIKEAAEADSYIKISFSKYSYLIYKAGATLKGKDDAVDYLEKRFRIMSFSTQKPIDILFQEIADDLVKYSNAFLIKKRVNNIPGLKLKPVLADKVVGGYFRVDPAGVKIKRDKNGNVIKYEQGYGDNINEFAPSDVIHFYMDKDANNAFGTPRIIAALEDVKLLRKIEGNISALIYRFSMPLYQWIVGLPQPGMQGTDPEIKKAEREVEMSSLDGIVITNERTTIKSIGAEGTALNAEGYLKYFENRVFSALGVSASQMGRGGEKQDSESMEAQIHDTVKYIQRIMSIFIKEYILAELLLEGGYNPIFNEDDIVNYEFEEISLETKVKKENHEMLKYQSNITTLDESRRNLGMKDSPKDEERLYKNLIDKKARLEEIDRTAEHQMELVKLNAKIAKEQSDNSNDDANNGSASTSNVTSVSMANKKPRSNKSNDPNKAVLNNNRPTNQHGTTSAKIKESHDIETGKHKIQFENFFITYEKARNDIKDGKSSDLLFPLLLEELDIESNRLIDKYSLKAVKDAVIEISDVTKQHKLYPNKAVILSSFYEDMKKDLTGIIKALSSEIKENDDINDSVNIFNKYETKLRYLLDMTLRKVYWYSYVKTGSFLNVDKAYVRFSDSENIEDKKDIINTNLFSVDDIPAYHSFCSCEVTYKKPKKEGDK